MKSDVATDLIRHVINLIIDNISNKIVDANINNTLYALRRYKEERLVCFVCHKRRWNGLDCPTVVLPKTGISED